MRQLCFLHIWQFYDSEIVSSIAFALSGTILGLFIKERSLS